LPTQNKLSVNQFAKAFREQNPGAFEWKSDMEIAELMAQRVPGYKDIIDFNTYEPPKPTYDPTITDHVKNTWHNLKTMGIEVPAYAVGLVSKMQSSPLDKLEWQESSENWRQWANEKTEKWLKEDKGIQGYLQWKEDTPFGLDNFYHFDMMARGLSDLVPSLATSLAATYASGGIGGLISAGKKAKKISGAVGGLLAMHTMEGSGEFNEAMNYLVDDPDGPKLKPSEAMDTALNSAITYASLAAPIEYFSVSGAARILGIGDDVFMKGFIRPVANSLHNAKKAGGFKAVAAMGTDVVRNALVQGVQEGTQQTQQLLVQNVYKKYGGDTDEAWKNFGNDLHEAIKGKETRQSFWSSTAASLLMGGLGGSGTVASATKRALQRLKRKESEQQLIEDTHEFKDETGEVGNPLAVAALGDVSITDPTESEQSAANEIIADSPSGDNTRQAWIDSLTEDSTQLNDINSEMSPDDWYNALNPETNKDSDFTIEQAQAVKTAAELNIEIAEQDLAEDVITEDEAQVIGEVASDIDLMQRDEDIYSDLTTEEEIAEAQKIDEPEIGVSQEDIDKYAAMNPNERQKELTRLKQGRVLNQKEINALLKNVGQETEESSKVLRDLELKKQQDKDKQEVLEALIRKDKDQLSLFTQPKPKPKPKKIPKAKDTKVLSLKNEIKNLKQELDDMPDDIRYDESAYKQGVEIDSDEAKIVKFQIEELEKEIESIQVNKEEKTPKAEEKKVKTPFGKATIRSEEGEAVENDLNAIMDEAERKGQQTTLGFQKAKKKAKPIANKRLAKAMEKRLKKQFPWVKAEWVEKVLDNSGTQVAGRAFKNVVEWSKGKATLDTIPHEYAHIYVDLLRDHPVIKEGIKSFKGEEQLVQYIGEYYTHRMQDKRLIARMKTWLRKFQIALKQFFGSALSDKEVGDLIGNKFFTAEFEKAPDILSDEVKFQREAKVEPDRTTTSGIKVYDNLFKGLSFAKLKKKILDTGRRTFGHKAAWYGPVEYTYTGITHKMQVMPEEFQTIARQIEDATGVPRGYYNSALVNLFPAGKGIRAHADNEEIFERANGTIGKVATVTLGGSSEITISGKFSDKIPVSSGSMYIMPGQRFQLENKHAVGKATKERISLTFRHIPNNRLPQEAVDKFKVDPQVAKAIISILEKRTKNLAPEEVASIVENLTIKYPIAKELIRDWARDNKSEEIQTSATKIQDSIDNPVPKNISPDTSESIENADELVQEKEDKQDNNEAINETEVDSSGSDSRKGLDRVRKESFDAIGVTEIYKDKMRQLLEDARNMEFDEWLNTSLKANTGKDLSNAKNKTNARRYLYKHWISIRSQDRINSQGWGDEMYHNTHLELVQQWTGDYTVEGERVMNPVISRIKDGKDRGKIAFYKIKGKLKKYLGFGGSIEIKAKPFTTKYIANNVKRISNLLKKSYLVTHENLYTKETYAGDAALGKKGSREAYEKNLIAPYKFINAKDMYAIALGDARNYEARYKAWKNGMSKDTPLPRKVPVFTRGENSAIVFAEINEAIRNKAKNFKAYWQEQLDKGWITKKQFESFTNPAEGNIPKVGEIVSMRWKIGEKPLTQGSKSEIISIEKDGENYKVTLQNTYDKKIYKDLIVNNKGTVVKYKSRDTQHIIQAFNLEQRAKKDSFNYTKFEVENEIAVFEFINEFYPGYLVYEDKPGGWANILKRIKIPLTPAFSNPKMEKSKALYIDSRNLKFQYRPRDENGEIVFTGPMYSGEQYIEDVGNNKHIGDGNSITGRSFFKKLTKHLGLDPKQGFAKTIIYDSSRPQYGNAGDTIDNSSTLMVKHQHSLADPGMVYYDNNVPVAEVGNDGNIYRLNPDGSPTNEVIDMIMTQDEMKVAEGEKYAPKSGDKKMTSYLFDIEGSSVGLIKYAEGTKKKAKFPHQWLNYLPKEIQDQVKDKYMGDKSQATKILEKAFNSIKDADSVKSIVKSIERMYPDEVPTVMNNFINNGSGFHPVSASQLSTMIVGKFMIPIMTMDRQKGTSAYLAPNYRGDLKEGDIALSSANSGPIFDKYKEDNPYDEKPTFKKVNAWLKRANVKVLVTRYPVPHKNGAVYLRVARIHNKTNVAEMHKDITFRYLEGDYDGDSITIEFPTKEAAPIFDQYFSSPDYVESIKGIDLGKFKKDKIADMTKLEDRLNIMQEMIGGQRSIGEIATTQAVYNSIKDIITSVTVKGVGIEAGDVATFRIEPNREDIEINDTGDFRPVDEVLRIYLQAAADNAKFLLLSDWKYNVNNLRQKLFKVYKEGTDGQPDVLMGTFYDYIRNNRKKAEGKDFKESQQPLTNAESMQGLWEMFTTNIWNLHKIPYALRRGNNGDGSKHNLQDYMDHAKTYTDYISNRGKYILSNTKEEITESMGEWKAEKYNKLRKGYTSLRTKQWVRGKEIVDVQFTDHVTPMEYLVQKIHEKNEATPKKLGQLNPVEFEDVSYAAANTVAVQKMSAAKNKLEPDIVAQNYGKNLFLDILKTLGGSNILPSTWDTNEDLLDVVDRYAKAFKNLTEDQQKLATHWYIEYMESIPLNEIPAGPARSAYMKKNLKQRLEQFAPVADERGVSLLHPGVTKAYFKEFNKELLESTNLKEKAENSDSVKEASRMCR